MLPQTSFVLLLLLGRLMAAPAAAGAAASRAKLMAAAQPKIGLLPPRRAMRRIGHRCRR